MTLTEQVTKKIIKRLLQAKDYRIEVISLINAQFLQFAIDFFKKVVEVKLNSETITIDWYKKHFILDDRLDKTDVAIHSGLNMKTINNMYNTERKAVVLDASKEHYDSLYQSISELVKEDTELDLLLTIKLKGVSVELNVTESLIVINTLAVKRAALRGGLWSTAGKRVEAPLMLVLCKLYKVDSPYFRKETKGKKTTGSYEREVDFFLISNDKEYQCEVKLMGKGNPEGADVVIARDSKVFIADKLSDTNKKQLDELGIEWVELRSALGFKKFEAVLSNLNIPFTNLDVIHLEEIVDDVFEEDF
ncbi:MAG: CfrBI family restriction endonuclease [Flavobacteriaceae bacterium]|nr:CfrBI family restriction endonuclease [Flavobacteriaceae bacterium]MCY4267013.1 CfrBI family restriction endonuclease [Flavobacteriaceae bacterium]